jgi:hypothetical protein
MPACCCSSTRIPHCDFVVQSGRRYGCEIISVGDLGSHFASDAAPHGKTARQMY